MIVTDCKKATLYTMDDICLCDVRVTALENETIFLEFEGPCAGLPLSEAKITFYDSIKGLLTCRCTMWGYTASAPEYSALCSVEEVLCALERRSDKKAAVAIPAEMCCYFRGHVDHCFSALIKNLSAGGLFFTSSRELSPGDVVHFTFTPRSKPLALSAEILRTESEPEGSASSGSGYGCRFLRLTASEEAQIRQFVFKTEVSDHKRAALQNS